MTENERTNHDSDPAPARLASSMQPDIRSRLKGVPGVSNIRELKTFIEDSRVFHFTIEQPFSHETEGIGSFEQHVELIYRDFTAPTVLVVRDEPIINIDLVNTPIVSDGLTNSLGANQITVEPRFYGERVPRSLPDLGLTMDLSSADLHEVIEKLKPVLTGNWISSGRQEGGTLAIHHRRNYPLDTHATVAFSAPFNLARRDPRYRKFLSEIGTAECRKRLLNHQKKLMELKMAFVIPREKSSEAGNNPSPFNNWPGGLREAFDHTVYHMPAYFWPHITQTELESGCSSIPGEEIEGMDQFMSIPFLFSLMYHTDLFLETRHAKTIQGGVELGLPDWGHNELDELFDFDVTDVKPLILGRDLSSYNGSTMADLYFWTTLAMNRLILVYGEHDPSRAVPLELAKPRMGEAHVFTAPGVNAFPSLRQLAPGDQGTAVEALERWAGVEYDPDADFSSSSASFLLGRFNHGSNAPDVGPLDGRFGPEFQHLAQSLRVWLEQAEP